MTQRLDYANIAADGMKAFGGVYGYVANSGLPKALVDLVYLRVSQINGCAYCIDMHSRDLLKGGLTVEKLVLVPAWREAGELFSERERAALRWAETVTRSCRHGRPRCGVRGRRWPVQRKTSRRPHHRDRPDERLQPHGHQLSYATGGREHA